MSNSLGWPLYITFLIGICSAIKKGPAPKSLIHLSTPLKISETAYAIWTGGPSEIIYS